MTAMQPLFVNENIGGHATMHLHLREGLRAYEDIEPRFIDVPPAGFVRRVAGVAVPGLGRLDLDLQPLRAQLALSMHVRRQVRRQTRPIDVLHVYSVNAGLAITSALRAIPSVVSTDSTNELNAYGLPYRKATRWTDRALTPTRKVEQRVYDAADMVVAQSEWVAASLQQDYGVRDDRLLVIPPGITLDERAAAERTPPAGLPQITFVGTTMDRKGGSRLLAIHRRHLQGRAVLNLVTPEAVPEAPGVRVYRDLRPGDPRLGEILADTAVFAFPSEIDKSSFAVLEAMTFGVPVVTTRVGALPELVPDGVAGCLVEAGDDDTLTEAIFALLDDEDLRARLGAGARARVLERFDIRVTTARLVELFRDVAGT